jgi:hypothetical protein
MLWREGSYSALNGETALDHPNYTQRVAKRTLEQESCFIKLSLKLAAKSSL